MMAIAYIAWSKSKVQPMRWLAVSSNRKAVDPLYKFKAWKEATVHTTSGTLLSRLFYKGLPQNANFEDFPMHGADWLIAFYSELRHDQSRFSNAQCRLANGI